MRTIDKKIKREQLCLYFNRLRLTHQHKSYTRQEMLSLLKSIGIRANLMSYLISGGCIEKFKSSNKTFYAFTNTPIYVDRILQAFKKYDENAKIYTAKYLNKKNAYKLALLSAIAILSDKELADINLKRI